MVIPAATLIEFRKIVLIIIKWNQKYVFDIFRADFDSGF